MNYLERAIEKAATDLNGFDYPQAIEEEVNQLTKAFLGSAFSPVDCVMILARTGTASAVGFTGAIADGLQFTEINDIDNLRHCVAALRASADIFEAILREGTQ